MLALPVHLGFHDAKCEVPEFVGVGIASKCLAQKLKCRLEQCTTSDDPFAPQSLDVDFAGKQLRRTTTIFRLALAVGIDRRAETRILAATKVAREKCSGYPEERPRGRMRLGQAFFLLPAAPQLMPCWNDLKPGRPGLASTRQVR